MRSASDRRSEVNGIVTALYRGIDENGFATWVCSCACKPSSKFRVMGNELAKTLSCGCLSLQAERALVHRRSLTVIDGARDNGDPVHPSANPSELPLAA